MDPDTFLYFAYGSNLLRKRIHINNPTAKFICIGKLGVSLKYEEYLVERAGRGFNPPAMDHRLDFIKHSVTWGGASATIVPTPHAHVWGSVWRIHTSRLSNLDKQEGVSDNWYFPKDVDIQTEEGLLLKCRVYQQSENPPPRGDDDPIPAERRPSSTYLETIIKGAVECKLPDYYIQMLNQIQDNGKEASESMLRLLREHV